MEIRPIFSALLRNSAGAILVSLQIAITLAIVVNAVYLVKQRVDTVRRPTGMDEQNMFSVRVTGFGKDFNFETMVREDMAMLRRIPGVVAATPTPQVPLSGSGSSTMFYSQPNEKGKKEPVAYYGADEQAIETLGTTLASGNGFAPEDIEFREKESPALPKSGKVIVTKAFAAGLFPNENALGKTIYDNLSQPVTIVGVIEHMQGSWVSWKKLDQVMLQPVVGPAPSTQYMIRAAPGEMNRVMADVEVALKKAYNNRVVGKFHTLADMKRRSYSSDTMIVVILGVVTALVVIFSALGIFGLATFNVNTRIRQIGTRRAIGARKLDIVRHFMVENWMVTSTGVVVGCILALVGGYILSTHYGLERLDLYYLVGGIAGLWLVGQVAAWQPSRRAATVSPAMATRNV
jgi:putative ABC transport system permease protein